MPAARFAIEEGFDTGLGGGFFRFARGLGAGGAAPGMGGAEPPGGGGGPPGAGGALFTGIRGAEGREVSESECALSAPVSIPPLVLFSLGMPPAKSPPSCGAPLVMPLSPPPPVPWSLLLLALFPPPGTGGARPVGAPIPGTGGAPPIGGPPPPDFFSTCGADRSFVTVALSFLPFVMSLIRAPYSINRVSRRQSLNMWWSDGSRSFAATRISRVTYPIFRYTLRRRRWQARSSWHRRRRRRSSHASWRRWRRRRRRRHWHGLWDLW